MSIAIYTFGVLTVVLVMLSSYFLGAHKRNHENDEPYESGIKACGQTNDARFFSHYFLVAILFVVFDLESVFLYLWSTVIVDLGLRGFFQMLFFICMLLLGLFYAISLGALNFIKTANKTASLP